MQQITSNYIVDILIYIDTIIFDVTIRNVTLQINNIK